MLWYPDWLGLLFWIPLRAKFMNISLLNIFMNNKNCFKLTSSEPSALCTVQYHPAILNIWHKNYLISTFDLTTSLPTLEWKLFYIWGQNQGINDDHYHLVFSLYCPVCPVLPVRAQSWGSQHNLNDCKPLESISHFTHNYWLRRPTVGWATHYYPAGRRKLMISVSMFPEQSRVFWHF